MKILLLEDDDFICSQVQNYFELDGNSVDFFHDGKTLLENAILEQYDIFLLDINTPKKNGLETLKEIRLQKINTPAIFITAQSDIEHLKMGYEVGCNDYVRKPFNFEELEIRMNQLILKCGISTIKINEYYTFDTKSMNLYHRDNIVDLSTYEKNLIYLLVKNINTPVNSRVIKDYVWEDKDVCDNTLRTQIKKIRSKLEHNFIENIRNLGYKIVTND